MKQGLVIHVQGVASLEEARQLESLGVDLISVFIGERTAGRVLGLQDARAISAGLKEAKLCVESPSGKLLPADAARQTGAQVVQVPWGQEVPRAWRESLAKERLQWALVRVPADEDDDPAWIRTRLEDAGAPPPVWTQVEVCPSLDDGWQIIRESNENELDARDLDSIAAEAPLLFSMPLLTVNINEVRQRLHHAKGFSFTLEDKRGTSPGAHRITLEKARTLLERLGLR
jgi:hypothetical protein